MSKKSPKVVWRSVVELDLVGYSHIARSVEQQTNPGVLFHLNDQVQGFVDDGLREVGIAREDVVNGTAGDNALLAFERASDAHRFSEAVHHATAKYNSTKTDPTAYRHFRIGISTGEIAIRDKAIAGTRIIDSVRLEAAGTPGHILIDEATHEELPAKLQQRYRGPESVSDKQKKSYQVYRCAVIDTSDFISAARVSAPKADGSASSTRTTCRADISRILKYAPEELIGRDEELKLLNDAWSGNLQLPLGTQKSSGRPHILTFVALGGEGKTSLVTKWVVDEMLAKSWPGCDAAFAWSFYSQGTKDQTAASDLFLKEALTFFGDDADKAFAASPAGAFEKGQRLARLVRQRRSLLILDGLEPLQYAPTSPTPGELKDQGIAALLKGLAAANHGLCIVTTRYSIPDLKVFWQTNAPEKPLVRLSKEAGSRLLQQLGVRKESGSKAVFEKLVEDVKGHALTLTLFGGFLKRAYHGDIRQRDRVKFEKADAQMDGGHAFRTMAAYEHWLLRDGGDEGRREVAVLRLMGLFDRPAHAGCLAALRSETIPGLTEPLAGLADDDWEYCLSGLEAAKLLTVNRDASSALVSLDAHPHLREYFARQLRTQLPDAWRTAHRRLYEHLCVDTKQTQRPTLEDLQPLYQAVAHGCLAGSYREARTKVLRDRIQRGNEYYSFKRLGSFGTDAGALACFFDEPWKRVTSNLPIDDRALVLSQTSHCLCALGRLTEALEPIRAGLEIRLQQKNWKNAAITSCSMSEIELTLGDVGGALANIEKSVIYAERSNEMFQRMSTRGFRSNALHQAGRHADAETSFRETEELQAQRQPDYPLLYSIGGFMYCDLLLAPAERAAWQVMLSPDVQSSSHSHLESCSVVLKRATQTLDWAVKVFDFGLLSIAFDHLVLSRALLCKAILTKSDVRIGNAEMEQAVAGLRRAGTSHHLPRGFLSRSWFRFLTDKRTGVESAEEDLDEAWEIAERGPMRLHMADILLHRARLFFREKNYPWSGTSAKQDLAEARKLIEKCGYWRRREELEDAEAVIGK